MPSKVIKRIEDVMKEKETERFQADVKTVVEKISSALDSVCSVMQAQAKGLRELINQSEVSDEIKLKLDLAEERISNIGIDVDQIRCHLEGHKLVLKELKRPIAFGPYRNTYRCERCQWSFGLDASEKLKRLY